MTTNIKTSKFGLDYGIYYGLAMIISFVLIYALNIDAIENPIVGTLSSVCNYFIFPILFITLAITTFKKSNNGFVSFGESIKTGVTVAFIASILLGIFSLLFNYFVPEYQEEIINQTRQIMLKQNPSLTSEQVDSSIKLIKKFSSPVFSLPLMILLLSFLGLIYSLVIGAIFKKERSVF